MGDEIERGVAEFRDIVGRDGGRHAHRDALRAIGQKVRHGGGEHDGLLLVAGVVLAEIDRVLLDAFQQQARHIGHARFGVAIGGGGIAVDIAEIALPIDHGVAGGEILGEAHQRVVNGLVAMGMERTHDIADDLRAFLEGGARIELEDMHAVEDAPVDRLQPVAGVGQRAAHDGGQRIGEIALFKRLAKVHHV